MSTHSATVDWSCDGDFAANAYSRAHVWRFDGGAEVPGSASPSVVPLPYSDATAVDPEEAFVASISSCHMLWFLDLARRAGYSVTHYVDMAEGRMVLGDDKRMWIDRVELRPQVTFAKDTPDAAALAKLHHTAHDRCFIANSIKTEVVVL